MIFLAISKILLLLYNFRSNVELCSCLCLHISVEKLTHIVLTVSFTSSQVRRNCFHLSQLRTKVAIGHRKPDAKSEAGTNLVMYDVY
jgi:hypothetical protein